MAETRLNRYAYLSTGLAVKALSGISRANVRIHDEYNIPSDGSIIFAINHFTRIETLIMPYHIDKLTNVPVWSLADYSLFKGGLKSFFDRVGVVSTKSPRRDSLIVKSLLTGEANWIIFPEGRMVKSKKIFEKGVYRISHSGGKHRPHTGVATLALRTEFYRERFRCMSGDCEREATRLKDLYEISDLEPVTRGKTYIVPVNITYYPIRSRENILSQIAEKMVDDLPDRIVEEIMTEGSMLISGVDLDIRFGKPISVRKYMDNSSIVADIVSKQEINFDDPIASRPVMRKVALEITQHYMSSIYNMTTVNHDHLFASLLKAMPFKRIWERDLRNRVFLAVERDLNTPDIYSHTSLESSQTHLLTDDRYQKYGAFIDVAIDKGNARTDGDTLIRNTDSFSADYDFHSVRVDNPISVIANEVEPLRSLQRVTHRLAWLPRSIVNRSVVKLLTEREISEFEADYEKFYTAGESKEKAIGAPFLIQGNRSRNIGVVLIHGYMAAPLQVAKIAADLGRRGIWVYVPRLKGHGTSPDDLAERTWRDWVESADTGYAIIRNICKRVIAGGFATGGVLALDLAARVGDVEKVFAVCPPQRLHDISSKVASSVWRRVRKIVSIGGREKEFIEYEPENPHISYARNPIPGIRAVERLMRETEPKLPSVKIPSLVLQSHRDPVADYRGSLKIFEQLGSEDKKYMLFNLERHCIILGRGSRGVRRAIVDFVEHS